MPFQVSLDDIAAWFQAYGYAVVFLALATENVLFTSVVVPGLLVLILAGYYAGIGEFWLPHLLLVGVAGVWAGDVTNYALGRWLWAPLASRSRRATRLLAKVQPVLEQRGNVFFVIYHFEPIARMVGALAAGTTRVAVRRWLPFDFLGAVLWVSFYGSVGFALGRLNRDVGEWTQVRPVQVAASLLVLAWLVFVGRTMRRLVQVDAPTAPR